MSSIFGNLSNQNQSQGQNTGLFGSSTNQPQGQNTGLFGSNTNQTQTPPQGTGLFPTNSNTQNPQQGTGLFGANANAPPQNTGLFGSNTTTLNQNTGSSLFGNRPQNTGLFGINTTQPASQFGGAQTQNAQQNTTPSLFSSQQPTNQQSSAFGPQQQQLQPNLNASLFPQSAPQRTYAERTFTNPQQTHLSSLLQSGLGSNPTAFGSLGTTSQTDLARSRLAASGIYAVADEKNTVEQIQTLVRKWDPNSQETLLQRYLYNAVNSAFAPFHHRNPEESEREWEEALAKKPAPIVNKDGDNVSFVPVLARGFKDLANRVEYQARTLNELRSRLHEMNNSLNAMMAKHQQSITVRLENVRRQHTVLASRCLRLAVKTQTLRNRGYPLDGAEEGLRRMLLNLNEQTFDPQYAAREEEIWARMVALRDRARWLEEEAKRVKVEAAANAGAADGSGAQGEEVSEEVVVKAKKILADYEGQIRHLEKELGEVRREFEEWEVQRR